MTVISRRVDAPRHYRADIRVRVAGVPDHDAVERLRKVFARRHRTLPADHVTDQAKSGREAVLVLTIREGRNRQVRRMREAVGHPVRMLVRTKFGPLSDRHMKPGEWRELTEEKWKSEK
jgi:23S rRNA pseudouridine2605 synthase